ncbi:MAG TPA: DUF192 domain-containing protein [bacterium]|nr:DUF192 domain-containing protein [bacterium]HPR86851.1 DUF192 domain-containing protein [bacterium]
MPIVNLSTGQHPQHRLFSAGTWSQRLLGFLALLTAPCPKALLIRRCNGIHTFSMPYPLGVAFLDARGIVLRVDRALPPGRIIPWVKGALDVLEWPAEEEPLCELHAGDQLQVSSDAVPAAERSAWIQFLHTPINLFLGLLWLGFLLVRLKSGLGWHTPAGWGLLCYNTLLVYLFFTRRSSAQISRNPLDWSAAIVTVVLSLLLRPAASVTGAWQALSLLLQLAAILAILLALASLGKSFGIVPANRRIKTGGAYRFVRHPLYAAELLFLAAFLLGNPGRGNLVKGALIVAGQIYRALAEERLLTGDPEYQRYLARVRCRFIPYIC